MAKYTTIRARVTAEERAALAAKAGGEGRLSEWLRRVAFRAAGLPASAARKPVGRPRAAKSDDDV